MRVTTSVEMPVFNPVQEQSHGWNRAEEHVLITSRKHERVTEIRVKMGEHQFLEGADAPLHGQGHVVKMVCKVNYLKGNCG